MASECGWAGDPPSGEGGSSARLVVVVAAVGVVVAAAGVSAVMVVAGAADGGGSARVVAETPVTAMHRARAPANNSPQIAVGPDGELVALANRLDKPGFGCGLHVSGDEGRSWVPVRPVDELPEGAETCYAPQVVIDGDGVVYFLFVGLSGEGNTPMGVFVARSTDGGRSFAEPVRLLGELNFGVQMAVDRDAGRLHFAWIDADAVGVGSLAPLPNPIMTAYSDDGGRRLSSPVQVNPDGRRRVIAPALAVGGAGEVHLAYYDLGDDVRDYQGLEGPVWDDEWELVVASSTDGGASFSAGEVVAEPVPHQRVMLVLTAAPPALAADEARRVCVGWTDGRRGVGRVWARCRPPQAGWHEPAPIADDGAGEAVQELPQLAIADDGRVDAVFYDGRLPPSDDFVDAFHAASIDGGASFAGATRVSGHSSYTEFGRRYGTVDSAAGMVEFGSRLGLAPVGDRAVAAWTDTRNQTGRSQGQDVFSAVLTDLPAGPAGGVSPAGWLAGGVAGLVVVAAAGWATIARRRRSSRQSTAPSGDNDTAAATSGSL